MNLANLVIPSWVGPVAILAAAGAVWFHGYHKGSLAEETVRNELVARVSQASFEQEKKTLNKIIKQKDISNATEVRLTKRLNAANKRLRERAPSSSIVGSVPPISQTPVVPDAAAPNSISVERFNGVVNDYNQLSFDCTKTTIIADEFQKWVVENLKE